MFSLPISLPDGFSIKTSVGSDVKTGDILAEKKSSKDVIVPLAEKFEISPKKVFDVLKKGLGDKISKGELLAEKKGIFGKKTAVSQFEGTILRLEEKTGRLHISSSEKGETEVLKSPIDGKITFCDNTKVVIETEKEAVFAVKSFGKETKGELIYLNNENNEKIKFEDIDKKVCKKIILAKSFERAAFSKVFGLGALAAIGLEVLDEDIDHFRQIELDALILQVNENSFKELKNAVGKQVYLNGKNKIIVVL
ncbi:MAG: hypothetical protein V1697_02145 [Candidatus Levyibacteriota bacterium]